MTSFETPRIRSLLPFTSDAVDVKDKGDDDGDEVSVDGDRVTDRPSIKRESCGEHQRGPRDPALPTEIEK